MMGLDIPPVVSSPGSHASCTTDDQTSTLSGTHTLSLALKMVRGLYTVFYAK